MLQQQQSKGCAHKRSEKLWNFLINDIEISLFFLPNILGDKISHKVVNAFS